MNWLWPLVQRHDMISPLPVPGEDGAFGTLRQHDVHTGVDLYCGEYTDVMAVQAGLVAAIVDFTGPLAGSPFYLPTKAVIVQHEDGSAVVYGEIEPSCCVRADRRFDRGGWIGSVRTVRPPGTSALPRTMLHFELWRSLEDVLVCYKGDRAQQANDWPLGGERPAGLLDPTPFLAGALAALPC